MSGAAAGEEVVRSAVPIVDLSALDGALKRGEPPDGLKKVLKELRPADVGRDLSRRDLETGERILTAADERNAAAMLRSAHPSVAARLLDRIDSKRAARLLGFVSTDYRVSMLGGLAPAARLRVEGSLPVADKELIDRLLEYPEGVVGRMMTTKIFSCDVTTTAGQALDHLAKAGEEIEVAHNCYVTDENGKLVGVEPLRELAVADRQKALGEIMTRDPIAVREDTPLGDAAEIIQTHDFLSLPIIDKKDGKLVGAVRVDDLLDAALEKVGSGILNQGAVAGKIAAALPYFQNSLVRVVRTRITWLVLLFVAETLTGTVLRHFEDQLAKVVALSFFIPLLIGTGGNAGSQTVSTVIRALALGEVRLRDWPRVLFKEVSAGFTLGVLLGGVAFGRAMLWGVSTDLAGCVAITVLIVCTWANTVGSVIPLLAQRVGIDPTVVSGPLITTLVDASGLFIYLTVAQLMIAQLHH
jgi:magnesium transporter